MSGNSSEHSDSVYESNCLKQHSRYMPNILLGYIYNKTIATNSSNINQISGKLRKLNENRVTTNRSTG